MRWPCAFWSGWTRRAGLIVLLALTISGCGKSSGTVTGHVKYKGEVVTAGNVTFYGPNDQIATALINPDGSYTVLQAPLGTVKVGVTAPPHMSKTKAQNLQRKKKGQFAPQTTESENIPLKYGKPDESGLELNVTKGTQPFEIDLK